MDKALQHWIMSQHSDSKDTATAGGHGRKVFAWWKDDYCLYSSHLRHPEEAPWKAGQLLSKFLFKWTQISAWRQSGKPYNTNSNKKTKHRYARYLEQPAVSNHLPLGPCSYRCRLYKTRHVESIPPIFVSVDSEFGRICWTLSLSAWLSDTWRHIQWSNECEENIMYYNKIEASNLAVPEYSLCMMAETFPNMLAYIRAERKVECRYFKTRIESEVH